MKMILHNLKVAVRNLMKYKLQTAISVLSIAVGIVTLSFTHSLMSRYSLPQIFDEPYADRSYMVKFLPTSEEAKTQIEQNNTMFREMDAENCAKIDEDIIRALKGNGGLRNAEKIVVPNVMSPTLPSEFHLTDSTIRQGNVTSKIIDPNLPDYSGITSAITGKKIGTLKAGEAIICEDAVKKIFGDNNPIGAVQSQTNAWQKIPVTIKDVFTSTSILEPYFTNCDIFYCISDSIEDDYSFQFNFTQWVNVVMRKGALEKDLKNEIDSKVAHLGYKSELIFYGEDSTIKKVVSIRILVNFIGSLILLAAIIGFLRIEVQLFWVRRHELALRIVNGAKRRQVFGCVFTEIAIVIFIAIIIALLFGIMLQEFFDTKFINFLEYTSFRLRISDLWLNSIIIGSGLLVVCSLFVWIALSRMAKAENGIVSIMRKSHTHLFRDTMLCIQIVICMVFVCCAFILYNGTENILKANNVPKKDAVYSHYLYIEPYLASDPIHLFDEISKLPDIENMIMYDQFFTALKELEDNPELFEKLERNIYYQFYASLDTTVLSTLGVDVKWNNNNIDRNECFILSEKTYDKFIEYGILDHSTLTINYSGITLPVGGTVKNMPYDWNGGEFIIAIYPGWEKYDRSHIIIPKEGRGNALAQEIQKTIERVEPQAINEMIFNFREHMNPMIGLAESVRTAGWILGIVSLIICIMSIFSTITLDTRSRRKEVAIRKVNGAKSLDIYSMFIRIYIVLTAIALVISVPICILFNNWIGNTINEIIPSITLSPVMPIILGNSIVIILIFMIVSWQINRVMKLNPTQIIAKE
ncbi:MAG: ABC transporter permease [Muribaculaceae bacterium]|nr:ABC transporter permease [Muribaculaceae bacterium]